MMSAAYGVRGDVCGGIRDDDISTGLYTWRRLHGSKRLCTGMLKILRFRLQLCTMFCWINSILEPSRPVVVGLTPCVSFAKSTAMHNKLQCWYNSISSWYDSISSWYYSISSWYYSISSWYDSISSWYDSISSWVTDFSVDILHWEECKLCKTLSANTWRTSPYRVMHYRRYKLWKFEACHRITRMWIKVWYTFFIG